MARTMYLIGGSLLVLGTCKGDPDATTIDYGKTLGGTFLTLEEAIRAGARTRNKLGKDVWLGVNLKVAIVDGMLGFYWLGKFRYTREWNRAKRPTDKYVQQHVERQARLNIPLDDATQVIWHWEE